MSEMLMQNDMEENGEEFTSHFVVEDDMTAEWCMTQIRNAEAEKAKWKAFYDERYRQVCASCDLTIANMTAVLETYFQKVPHKVTATQENYHLPSGKLVFKKQEPEYVRDDETVMQWMRASNSPTPFIKTKDSLDWGAFKKTLTVCGEVVADEEGNIVPGITVTERPDTFKVELKEEK